MDDMHRYTDETEALSKAIVTYARNRIASPQTARRLGERRPARPARRRRPSRPRASAARRPCACGARRSLPPRSRPTTPPRWRSCRARHQGRGALRPRGRRLVDDRRGLDRRRGAIWAADGRRCAGSPTSPASPEEAGGVFVSGGSAGNLSALVAARARAAAASADAEPPRLEDRGRRQRAFLGRHRRPRDRRGHRGRARRRTRAAHRRRPRRHARRARPRRGGERRRGRRERRRHECGHGRRPRGRGRGLRASRGLVPRRRGLRRCRARGTLGARALPRHRACRLVHRRPAAVAVRALRLLRSRLPRPHRRVRGVPAGSRLPRHGERSRRRLERVESARTTPTTCPDAPGGSRCGSRSRPTAPTPTATRSSACRRSCARRPGRSRGPSSSSRWTRLSIGSSPARLGRRRLRTWWRWLLRRRSPSCSRPRGRARSSHGGAS